MRHAQKVIELMAAFPGRDFRLIEICRYIEPTPKTWQDRSATHRAVHRVLEVLAENGAIIKRRPQKSGGFGVYRWKTST